MYSLNSCLKEKIPVEVHVFEQQNISFALNLEDFVISQKLQKNPD
jgi:hypothetical protein